MMSELYNIRVFLSSDLILRGTGDDTETGTVEDRSDNIPSTQTQGSSGGGFNMMIILVYIAVIGAVWFFTIRPQRKRDKELVKMQESLKTGDEVITSSGFYGKIVDVDTDFFIIEFGVNKPVKIPVRKRDVIGQKTADVSMSKSDKITEKIK